MHKFITIDRNHINVKSSSELQLELIDDSDNNPYIITIGEPLNNDSYAHKQNLLRPYANNCIVIYNPDSQVKLIVEQYHETIQQHRIVKHSNFQNRYK